MTKSIQKNSLHANNVSSCSFQLLVSNHDNSNHDNSDLRDSSGQDTSSAEEDPQCSNVTMETEEDRQQIAIPPDLFKDFEAIRSQTKLGAEDLMRHLLKEYQRYPCLTFLL